MYEVDNIIILDIAIHKNRGWFFNWGYNAIFELDFDTGIIKLEALFEEDFIREKESFGGVAYYKEKLYFGPRRGTQILIYDLITKKCSFIDIDLKTYSETENFNFIQRVVEIEGNIYFFPGRFHAIIKLNPENNELTYIGDWYKAVKDKWLEKDNHLVIFNNVNVYENGNCTIGCRRADFILKINVFNGEYSVIETGLKGKISDIGQWNGNYIILMEDESSVYEINNSEVKEIIVKINNNSLKQLCIQDSNLFIIPITGLDIIKVDLNSCLSEIVYSFSKEKYKLQNGNIFFKKQIAYNTIFMFSNLTGEIILLNTLDGTVCEKKLLWDTASRVKIQKYMNEMFSKSLFFECASLKLKNYLEDVSNH